MRAFILATAFLFAALLPAHAQWDSSSAGPGVVNHGDGYTVAGTGNVWGSIRGTTAHSAGKKCFEVNFVVADASASVLFGLATAAASMSGTLGFTPETASVQWITGANNLPFVDGPAQGATFSVSASATSGSVTTICVDFSTGNAWFALNGDWKGGDPAAGTGAHITGLTGDWFPAVGVFNAYNMVKYQPFNLQYMPAGYEQWSEPAFTVNPPAVSYQQCSPGRFGHSCKFEIEPLDPRPFLKVRPATAQAMRDDLAQFVYKGPRQTLTPTITTTTAFNVPVAGPIESWLYTMPNSITSEVFFIPSTLAGNCLFMWHAGHETQPIYAALDDYLMKIVQPLVGAGCDVLLVSMPGFGVNGGSTGHANIGQYDTSTFSAMSYFLSPVASALDEALSRKMYSKKALGGFSGGGWTATVAGATDTRWTHLYPIAGSMPVELDIDPALVGGYLTSSKNGDYEQSHAPFYAIANYWDLYMLGAMDGRRAVYIKTTGEGLPAWVANAFAGRLEFIAHRDYSAHITFLEDMTAAHHQLTPWAAATMVQDFIEN